MRLSVFCLMLSPFIGVEGSLHLCTAPGHVPPSSTGSRLMGSVFLTLTSPGLLTCARECLTRSLCCSFNFHLGNGSCELNWSCGADPVEGITMDTTATQYAFTRADSIKQKLAGGCDGHTCPYNSKCRETGINTYQCDITHCENKEITHGSVNYMVNKVTPVNHTVSYSCDVGYVPCGTLQCQSDSTWTNAECKAVRSCADVRSLNNSYSDDDEYWLYPAVFSGIRVKVYCHDMTGTPTEYISLATPYVMDAPAVSNYYCSGESAVENDHVGTTVFWKIAVNIATMVINENIYTFANRTSVSQYEFGYVTDCYTVYPNACGPKGNAVIDTRGTGLKLKDGVNWSYAGDDYPPQVTRSHGGQVIQVFCGGWCGACWVSGAAELTFVEADMPLDDAATFPSC